MGLFSSSPRPAVRTLRVLALLLAYPDDAMRDHARDLVDAVQTEAALGPSRQAELVHLVQTLARRPLLDLEADYVELFDRGRSTSLLLFEHVHGDSRGRGPAMIDLIQTFESAGLLLSPEQMPDHLSVLLEFASTQPPAQAREFLNEFAPIARLIFSALLKRRSPYACVLGAVLELAGERAEAVAVPDEPDVDEQWAEPEAFAGCSVAGQARPSSSLQSPSIQPIQIVRHFDHGGGALS